MSLPLHVPSIITYKREDGSKDVFICHEKLGQGGFAAVYRVKHQKTNKIYAMKVTSKDRCESPKGKQMLEKLQNEIQIQKKLTHPNIVQSKISFSDEFNYYIALEYCPGKTIREYLKNSEKGYLKESETRKILRDVVNGLAFLHNRKIIHHDLKLENFIIGSDGRVKIADFGLATLYKDDDEKSLSICGTPNYMSPEMLSKNGKGTGFESDVWAIGIAAFTMLTGRAPFAGCTKEVIYENIKNCVFNFPSQIPLSFEAREFIKSILKFDPRKRPEAVDLLKHPFLTQYDSEQIQLYKPIHKAYSFISMEPNCTTVKNNETILKRSMSSMNYNYDLNQKQNQISKPILPSSPIKGVHYSNLCQPNLNHIQNSDNLDNSIKKLDSNKDYQNHQENEEMNTFNSNVKKNFTIPNTFVTKYSFLNGHLVYLLGNGTVGICFDDNSRIVMDPNEKFVQHYNDYNSLDEIVDIEDDSSESNEPIQYKISLVKKVSKAFKKFKALYEISRNNYVSSIPLLHITYFIRKDNSILFKLNNKNIQVAFSDNNNLIIFWSTKKVCFFKNIKEKCGLLDLNEVSRMNPNADELKRFKKAKELLNALAKKMRFESSCV